MAGPVAFVTGVGSGIGRATAERLGCRRLPGGRLRPDKEGLDRTVAAVGDAGGRADGHVLDLVDGGTVDEVVRRLAAEVAPSALVNVAGVGVARTIIDTTPEEWELVLGVNLGGVYRMCRAALPAMIAAGGGVIVNVASVAGLVGVANRAAYCASKAGVVGLTKAIAVDHSAQGIRAVAVCPGTVATEWIAKILADAPDSVAARQAMEARQDGQPGGGGGRHRVRVQPGGPLLQRQRARDGRRPDRPLTRCRRDRRRRAPHRHRHRSAAGTPAVAAHGVAVRRP